MTTTPAPTRRHLLGASAVGAAALALTACGGDADGGSGGADAGSEDSGTRVVTDAAGAEVTVPATPQRVVTLHYAGTQAMIDLGVVPAGTAGLAASGGADATTFTSEEMWEVMKDIPQIDAGDGVPDVEKVAELEPDLILATNALEDSVIGQMEDIAPTFQFLLRGGERGTWWTRTQQIADALNVTDAYDELHASWQEELDAAAEEYQDVTADLVVGAYDMYEEGNVYLWAEENMVGTVLSPLGFTWSEQENAAVADESEPEKAVAVEQTLDVLGDATILFYGTDMQNTPNPLVQAYQESDLYQQLPAVQDGRAFPFGKCTIAGFTDARYSLAQVTAALDTLRG